MPCNCRQRAPIEVPDKSQWGPLLWSYLHTVAEKSSSIYKLALLWRKAIAALEYTIPCPECREHFASYIAANAFNPPAAVPECKEYVRTWLWEFHNHVNARLGKPAFNKEELSATYAPLQPGSISASLTQLMSIFKAAGIISMNRWYEFNSCMNMIIRL
jgi:hypothetical protein